jgi:hypothetical protein
MRITRARGRGIAVVALVALTLLAARRGTAQSDALPDLSELTTRVRQVHPEYVNQRADLSVAVAAFNVRATHFNSDCGSIDADDSAKVKSCQSQLAQLQAERSSLIRQVRAFNTNVEETLTVATPERHYTFAGNGLIGGTTWTLYASRKPGEPEQRMCDVIKQQSKLAGSRYDSGVDCKRYQFVLGIAVSVDPFTDLSDRVAFDDLTNGQFSAHAQGLYDKLRGKQFDELGCHSNGAMICLAALENQDIQAVHVVLYGPQVTRESLDMWNKLVRDGRVKSVKVYLNENDPVPGASIAYADYKKNQLTGAAAVSSNPSVDALVRTGVQTTEGAVSDLPLFQIESLKRTINETSPRLEVQTFPCKLDMGTLGCHELTMYKAKVNCTGKSSGNTVPGTGLHGKGDLKEPPLPCDAIGAKQ